MKKYLKKQHVGVSKEDLDFCAKCGCSINVVKEHHFWDEETNKIYCGNCDH